MNIHEENSSIEDLNVRLNTAYLKDELLKKNEKLSKKKNQGLILRDHVPKCFSNGKYYLKKIQ